MKREKPLMIRVNHVELALLEEAAAQAPNRTTGQEGVPLARFIREAALDATTAKKCCPNH